MKPPFTIVGPIPDFSNCAQLETLNLSENALSGTSIMRSTDHTWHLLAGEIPSFENNLALHVLLLNQNQLSGASCMRSTDRIWYSFAGSIPDFSSNAALEFLRLDRNNLEGKSIMRSTDHTWNRHFSFCRADSWFFELCPVERIVATGEQVIWYVNHEVHWSYLTSACRRNSLVWK